MPCGLLAKPHVEITGLHPMGPRDRSRPEPNRLSACPAEQSRAKPPSLSIVQNHQEGVLQCTIHENMEPQTLAKSKKDIYADSLSSSLGVEELTHLINSFEEEEVRRQIQKRMEGSSQGNKLIQDKNQNRNGDKKSAQDTNEKLLQITSPSRVREETTVVHWTWAKTSLILPPENGTTCSIRV
ncbi:hypothetical protein NDU88_009377 [Pleurodeles waltl]|uniref:Uncharacterized protein n=1 Tax=Pleurodeles waltl TaxID=8319 RepID=A0AAV7QV40_PLEWA|nr:hypothetical protein NDU88_009377 [Pleurodeles waltl]